MKKEFEKIIENELAFKELATKQFSKDATVTRSNVKEVLIDKSKRIRKIIDETNNIIDEYITPFLKDPTDISKQKALEFQKFAQALSGYRESIDTGLSYDIRHALTQYAKHVNDEELYIHNTFYKGLALFYLDRSIFKKEMSVCYEEIISFANRYEEFNEETRNLITRAHGNYYISVPDNDIDECYRRYDVAEKFWNDIAKKKDPDFPWASYFFNLHENLCSTTLSILRSKNAYRVTKEHKKRMLESAEYIQSMVNLGDVQTNDYTSVQIRHRYFIEAARYYNKKISTMEFLDTLYSFYKQAKNENTYDDLYRKVHISALYLYYVYQDPPKELSKKEREKIVLEMERDVLRYIESLTGEISQAHTTTTIAGFASVSRHIFNDITYLKLLLSMTVFRHPPTYVHSVVVAKISHVITEYLIKHSPEQLIGLPNINTVEDVKNQADEILKFVWYCGLSHDIGKILYSHLVSFYVRRLNDKEFIMIKEHPSKADNFINPTNNFEADSVTIREDKKIGEEQKATEKELFDCFSDVAFGHHKSYDGKFGYPADFDNLASPVKVIIDIVSIADSIDAATDSVGRSYADEKFLSDMKDDLLSQIYTRYNPEVTKAIFKNQELYDVIDNIISEYRYDIYYSCFSDDDFSQTMGAPTQRMFE